MKLGDKDVILKLGDKDVTVALGDITIYTSNEDVPSSGVPLDSSFAVMVGGTWHQYNLNPEDHVIDPDQLWADDIVAILQDDNIDSYDVEELSVGCETFVNLDGGNFPNCTGLTLSPCVTGTSDIHNFDTIGWVYVMSQELDDESAESGLFQGMNCCPVYVVTDMYAYFENQWQNTYTDGCSGSLADRLRMWGDYPEPCPCPNNYDWDE